MPKNELMDRIQACFREYKYWPFKALKAKLQQPESYLKEILLEVATLVRQGPHNMTWRLQPGYDMSLYEAALDAAAPENLEGDGMSDRGDGGTEDEKDNVKMEDVV